jgi:hypothetical protein
VSLDPKKRAELERHGASTRADVEAWLADQEEEATRPRQPALRRWLDAIVGAAVALVGRWRLAIWRQSKVD